jgi:hypothetical protein
MILTLESAAAAASSLFAGCIPQTLPTSDAIAHPFVAEDGSLDNLLPVLSTTLFHVK